ncbi:MAG: HAD-IIB family hydrolase [Floccifex porci]|uniref:HAD-IIB family hydrolase n=1 Tax=Floccifex porci TaxID=2606629 RepID=UPI003F048E1C
MIKLVVSDLDGTLIPEGTQEFEPGFFEALEELLNRGYEFYAASGRQYVNMYEKFGEYADRIGYLSDNGALAIKGGKRLFVEEIPRAFALEVAAYAQSMQEVDILVSGVEHAYFFPKTEWFKDHILNVYGLPAKMPEKLIDIQEPMIKISMNISDFEKNAQKVKQRLTRKYGRYAEFLFTGNGWLDMLMKGSGKGKALGEISKLKGLKPEEIMTFGDNQNDISMLRATPNSYAKANASDDVRASAAHTCENVIDVWRKVLFE